MLQEAHSTPQIISKWEKEWLGISFWHSCPKKKSSGVAILIKPKTKLEIINNSKDVEGKLLTLTFIFEKQIFQTINIYAPTNPSQRNMFFKNLQNYITNINNTIIGDDFNMVEDVMLDRRGGTPSNSHLLGLQYLQIIKQKSKITDTWRKKTS